MTEGIISPREKIPFDVFDYSTLVSSLSGYKKPRDKITKLLLSGNVIRIRKGLYCFGDPLRKEVLSREYLANLIYGPSYVSLKYALAYHRLIPERVNIVTSVTTKRSRDFTTPIGDYSYRMMTEDRYAIGADLFQSAGTSFLIATPEKALIDEVWDDKRLSSPSIADYKDYLLDDLRIDPARLDELDSEKLSAIGLVFDSRKVYNLIRCITLLRGGTHA